MSELEIEALLLSLKVAVISTAIGLPLAIAAAWGLARHAFWGKSLVNALIHAPLVVPPVVIGYLLLISFNPNAPLGRLLDSLFGFSFAFSWTGAALAAGIMGFPLMVRAIRLSFESGDPKLVKAARTLGAGPVRSFFTISLPLAAPGLIAAALLGFARALGEFGATITFVSNIPGLTQTLPLALFSAVQAPGGEDAAFRLMMISLAIALGALFASDILARRVTRQLGHLS